MVSHLHAARALAESLDLAVHLYRRAFTRFVAAMAPPALLLVAVNVVIPLFLDTVTFVIFGSVILSFIVAQVYRCAAEVIADQLAYPAPPARLRLAPLLQLVVVTYLTFVGSALYIAVVGVIAALVALTAGDCSISFVGLSAGGGCQRAWLGYIVGLAVVGIAALVLFGGLRWSALVGPAAIYAQRAGLSGLRAALAQTSAQRHRSRQVLGVLALVHGIAYVVASLLWQMVWAVLFSVVEGSEDLRMFAENATLPIAVVSFLAVLPVQALLLTLVYLSDTGTA
jgi:hypothetical protein